jgi:tRNA pseudouridine55 synthase
LARDLGQRLGCGGLVASLQRTRIGPFHVEDALSWDDGVHVARSQIRPLKAAVAELPPLTLTLASLGRLRQGQGIVLDDDRSKQLPSATCEVAVFEATGVLAAVAVWNPATRQIRPEKVIAGSAQ